MLLCGEVFAGKELKKVSTLLMARQDLESFVKAVKNSLTLCARRLTEN